MRRMSRGMLAAAVVLALGAAACSSDGGAGDEAAADDSSVTVYSGRDQEFVAGLFTDFTDETGIPVFVRYGDSAELAATIIEEGDNSPADLFFSQDAGSLGAVAEAGLLTELDEEIVERVEPRFRAEDGTWVGTSGRARVAVYNTDVVSPADLPDSIMGFTDPRWKGRIGFAPTNSSFQAFVAMLTITEGEDGTRGWLEGIMANDPEFYEDNSATVRAAAAGDIDVGFVNHYYKFEVEAEDGDLPIENHFFGTGDPGAMINSAGVGILASAAHPDEAAQLVDFMTSEPGQTYFATETYEYPTVPGGEATPNEELVPIDEIEGPDVDLSELGAQQQTALELMAEAGML